MDEQSTQFWHWNNAIITICVLKFYTWNLVGLFIGVRFHLSWSLWMGAVVSSYGYQVHQEEPNKHYSRCYLYLTISSMRRYRLSTRPTDTLHISTFFVSLYQVYRK